MGLFSKLFGSRDKPATPTFDLTAEEELEVDTMFNLLKGYAVHPSVADKLTQGLTARGLSNYATDQIMKAELPSQSAERENCINKAVSAIGKAYSIYQLPIYLYDLACYFELKNMGSDAKKMYELFLAKQAEYKSDQLDHIFLGERNIDEAKGHASQKLRGRYPLDYAKSLKSKVSTPLANKHNVEYIDSISKLTAINSVKRVVTLEEGLLFFDENFVETIISYNDSEKTMRLRNAAFEYWFFSLRVLFYCLEEIANEYDNGNQEIFLIPVYVKIIQTSKEYLKAEITNKQWDIDNYDYGEQFDSLMKNKLSELLLKSVMPTTLDVKPLSEKNSALDLTIYNAINVLGAEVSDPVYQLRLITNQMDATKDFRDICKDVFKDMRRLMKQ